MPRSRADRTNGGASVGPSGSAGVPPAPWCRPSAWLLAGHLLVLASCNAGSYPIDIFPEMHYAPSQRRLEPERLPPPADAVAVTGGRPVYTWDQANGLTNPVPRSDAALGRARATFAVNCAICHGADRHGQSTMATYFTRAGLVPPVDLGGARAQGRTDGQLYWIVANGLGGMPPFGDLLADDDLWGLVQVIRDTRSP
ncbi:MAG TPA: cytochrome c [Chloroflexota bacterium]|jgi:mono/diheme cytochrome c family protein